MFSSKCPLCGTPGSLWHKQPEAFMCPNCDTIYSKYGLVFEADADIPIVWH